MVSNYLLNSTRKCYSFICQFDILGKYVKAVYTFMKEKSYEFSEKMQLELELSLEKAKKWPEKEPV